MELSRMIDELLRKKDVMVPSFDGKADPAMYLAWELKVSNIFRFANYSGSTQVQVATMAFTDLAMQWWVKFQERRQLRRDPPISSWLILKHYMKEKWVPDRYYTDQLHRPGTRDNRFVERVDKTIRKMDDRIIARPLEAELQVARWDELDRQWDERKCQEDLHALFDKFKKENCVPPVVPFEDSLQVDDVIPDQVHSDIVETQMSNLATSTEPTHCAPVVVVDSIVHVDHPEEVQSEETVVFIDVASESVDVEVEPKQVEEETSIVEDEPVVVDNHLSQLQSAESTVHLKESTSHFYFDPYSVHYTPLHFVIADLYELEDPLSCGVVVLSNHVIIWKHGSIIFVFDPGGFEDESFSNWEGMM